MSLATDAENDNDDDEEHESEGNANSESNQGRYGFDEEMLIASQIVLAHSSRNIESWSRYLPRLNPVNNHASKPAI